VQDADGVTTTCRDRLTGKEVTIRSKYLLGADGGNSRVAELEKLPFEGQMGVGGSMNIIFKADLSKYVAHRPSVLYWVVQPGADVGGIGMGLVRMVRPWNEWLIVWGYDINGPNRRWTMPLPPRWCAIWLATSPGAGDHLGVDLDGQQHVRHAHAVGPGLHHGRRSAPASAIERPWLQHLDPGQLQHRLEAGRGSQGQAGAYAA
jgi:hypothetical protein